ncbi:MAG: hypothetical protein QXX35_00410 [Desulfurococcaceae archaeon]|uniref:Uncharacterized protein n=1 Tax=Staphylothermus marinus TaxID=2280 RepID=A0A7C4H8U4_STAMA
MGRNTPSIKTIVYKYVNRLSKIVEILPQEERIIFTNYLNDLETTISICSHIGVDDPLEILFIHLLRRMKDLHRTW